MTKLADEVGMEKYLAPPPAGWRFPFNDGGAVVVFRRHEKFDALIAATIL